MYILFAHLVGRPKPWYDTSRNITCLMSMNYHLLILHTYCIFGRLQDENKRVRSNIMYYIKSFLIIIISNYCSKILFQIIISNYYSKLTCGNMTFTLRTISSEISISALSFMSVDEAPTLMLYVPASVTQAERFSTNEAKSEAFIVK